MVSLVEMKHPGQSKDNTSTQTENPTKLVGQQEDGSLAALPGFNDVAAQADLPRVFQELQAEVDLSLDLIIRVHPGQVHPAVQP